MKKCASLAALLAALTVFDAQPGLAQPTEELRALRKELDTLKEGQTAIQKELQEIKTLLRTRPAPLPGEPQDVVLSVVDAPLKGDTHAKLTLIDFSDFQ